MGVERPETGPYTEADRKTLEHQAAQHVAYLLAYYGEIDTEVEVDNGDCLTVDEPKTYSGLSLDPRHLEKDHQFVIGQFPYEPNGFRTDPGVHSISVDNEDDDPLFSLTVYDPVLNHEPPISMHNGTPLELASLVEVVDALKVLRTERQAFSLRNEPPHDTSAYPIPATDPAFEAIISQLI